MNIKEPFFSLWGVQNYAFIYISFMLLLLFAFHHREMSYEIIFLLQNSILYDIFFSISLCLCTCVFVFWELWHLWQGKNYYACSKIHFWNRIVSHTSHFKAHSHYQPAKTLLLYQFSSSFPLPFLFKYTLIFDIYAWICMYLLYSWVGAGGWSLLLLAMLRGL